jgi:thiaminase/transcriptional activator TenA
MRFTDELRAAADEVWQAQHDHSFVRSIAEGSVDPAAFREYVRQDYVFLVDYARLLALGAARAPDLPTMRRFADLAQAILGEEMELHRAFAREVGIDERELERTAPAPLTRAYVDALLRTAALGDFAELAAALLPCMWGYSEVGLRIAAETPPPGGRPAHLDRWIATYADAGFAELAAWCRGLVDGLADAADPATRGRMRAAFLMCSEHELRFWDVGASAL